MASGRVSYVALMLPLVVAEIACSLESNMIFAAMSRLYALYGDPLRVGWLITAFTIAAAGSAAIGGRLGDLYGRRRVLMIMLALSCSGSLVSAAADSLAVVMLGRVLQGMTMAILPLCFGILRENLPQERMAFSVGLLGSVYSLMVGVGVLIGGFIVDHFDWQAIFLVSAAVAATALVAAGALLPKSPPAGGHKPIDVGGGLLFVPGIAATLYGVTELGRGGLWGAPGAMSLLGIGLLLLWARYQWHHPDPLLNLRLFRNREIGLVSLGIFLAATGPMMSSLVLLPIMQQPGWTGVGFDLSAATAGLIKLPGTVISGLCILAAGAATKWVTVRFVLLLGTAVTVGGWAAFAAGHQSLWLVAVLTIFVLSSGIGVVNAMAPQVVISNAPGARTSEATGLLIVVRTLGTAVGAQIVAACLASDLVGAPGGGQFPSASAFLLVSLVIMAFALASGIAFLALTPQRATVRDGSAPARSGAGVQSDVARR